MDCLAAEYSVCGDEISCWRLKLEPDFQQTSGTCVPGASPSMTSQSLDTHVEIWPIDPVILYYERYTVEAGQQFRGRLGISPVPQLSSWLARYEFRTDQPEPSYIAEASWPAISSPIASEAVAPGLGAFSTCSA